MNLKEAKKQIDHTLASLFYERMKNVEKDPSNAQELYKTTINGTSQLLLHMRDRVDVLFGQDSEALSKFLSEAGIVPES